MSKTYDKIRIKSNKPDLSLTFDQQYDVIGLGPNHELNLMEGDTSVYIFKAFQLQDYDSEI